MKYLFFDTETTGLPKDYKAPLTDSENWPRLAQLAFILTDGETIFSKGMFIVKPEGFHIPDEAAAVHRVTDEIAVNGQNLPEVIGILLDAIDNADMMVGHNISFDRKIIGAEIARLDWPDVMHGKPRICTMHTSTKYCAIPHLNRNGIKWPRLEELYKKLFNKKLEGAHDALVDIEATKDCFFELKKLDVITEDYINQQLTKYL